MYQICKQQWSEIQHKVKQAFQLGIARDKILKDILKQLNYYKTTNKKSFKDWFNGNFKFLSN